MDTSSKSDINSTETERARRRLRTFEEKLAMVEEATQPGASVAAVARKYAVNSNLLFAWLRLHRRGLLQSQRHGKCAPLLPVKITTPTLIPTERASSQPVPTRPRRSVKPSTETMLEITLPDGAQVRLHGEAQREVLDRVLEWLPRR